MLICKMWKIRLKKENCANSWNSNDDNRQQQEQKHLQNQNLIFIHHLISNNKFVWSPFHCETIHVVNYVENDVKGTIFFHHSFWYSGFGLVFFTMCVRVLSKSEIWVRKNIFFRCCLSRKLWSLNRHDEWGIVTIRPMMYHQTHLGEANRCMEKRGSIWNDYFHTVFFWFCLHLLLVVGQNDVSFTSWKSFLLFLYRAKTHARSWYHHLYLICSE